VGPLSLAPGRHRAEPVERPSTEGRDPLFDNARLVLIAMVVTAHVIRLNLYEVGWARALYAWLLVFMMPAFALIAGHLSSAKMSVGRLKLLVRRLVVPYLVFELLYTAAHAVGGRSEGLVLDLLAPTWVLWFLVTLFWWRLTLPLLMKTGHPLLVVAAIGVAGGFLPGPVYALALTRAMVLYPFFVLGHVAAVSDHVQRLRARPLANVAVLAAVAILAAAFLTGDGELWLHGTQPYANMGVPAAVGPLIRLAYYGAVALTVASFLALVPSRQMRVTALGERTLYPYLLHGVVLLGLEPVVTVPYSWPAGVGLVAAGVALAVVLSTTPVMRATRVLVDPVGVVRRWRR
jgi:fucose 4-O-acetylase-like acetyltransferase